MATYYYYAVYESITELFLSYGSSDHFFLCLFWDGNSLQITMKMVQRHNHVFLYLNYTLTVCCHLLVGKGANKLQECLHSKEYHVEEGIVRIRR